MKNVPKKSWRVRSLLMGGRSGRANSVRSQLCGQGGAAGAATMTFRQCCVGSAGGRSPQGLETGFYGLLNVEWRGRQENKSLEAENMELREALEKKVKEAKEGKGFHQREKVAWKKSGVWRCTSRMRPRVERSWMNKRGKLLQRELRDIEKFSCVPKESQESLESNLQQQLPEVEQRRHDIMPEHQKAQKRSQKTQNIQDSRRNLQKDSTADEEEMRKLQEELKQNEERVLFLSNKFDKNKMQDAEMAAELQSLQAGEERRGSNASQTGDGCLWKHLIALGANGIETFVQRLQRGNGSGTSRCQEKKEKKQRRRARARQGQSAIGVVSVRRGAMKALQRVVWSLIFLGFGLHLVKAEEKGSQVQQ